ncbi:alpha/beta fold hydrolase [Saccharospirillum mangrovi]|uniref:alpha/beta fold hydrolase n=1 Tax=Saccharospirillum mangrovi TaxID=2161747 RepID=UPI001E3FCE5B|nr:alpha/beta fold hydrolase [Saccharospirillum mangrovi]
MSLSLQTLDELILFKDNVPIPLPSSKRTRALLVYLMLTERMHRRDWLCELLWAQADDPRGALRWSLSRMRPLVNDSGVERLWADRERVHLNAPELDIDIRNLATKVVDPDTSAQALKGIDRALQRPLLEGLDLPDQELFQNWLTAERRDIAQLRGQVLARLAVDPRLTTVEHLEWSREWLALEPLNPKAATCLLTRLEQLREHWELGWLSAELKQRFHKAGIDWSAKERLVSAEPEASFSYRTPERELLARQTIQLCVAKDGVRLAYTAMGSGRPIIKAANWLSHLEHDWNAPIWSPLFKRLALNHHFIRYDERGNGLSDWLVNDLSFDAFVTDLEAVADASGVERFALLGISQGAAVSIAYAVKHPERVSHLVLFGGYPAGWRINASDAVIREREAIMTLTETGWGQDNPAYRQIFSSTFMPSADVSELAWFNEFQRLTTSPENAVRFLSAFGDIDVRHLLPQVRVPTLVLHSLGDQRIPVGVGRDLAAAIPGAQFQGIDSDGHLLLGREPASEAFIDAVRRFIASTEPPNAVTP